jgi:hypothetical protein
MLISALGQVIQKWRNSMGNTSRKEGIQGSWFQEKMQTLITNAGWHGSLSGVESEALLRGNENFVYILRQGEKSDQFYLTFVRETEFIHLPFTVDYSTEQWFYRNNIPHFSSDLDTFIPEIMHCEQKDCKPLPQFAMKK